MSLHRRQLLRAAAATGLVTAAPAAALAVPGSRLMLFDPRLPEARVLAAAARGMGEALVPLEGDPMRFWRERVAAAPAPVSGVTRWSDFVVFAELARERRLKLRRETSYRIAGGPLLIGWRFA